MTIIGTIATLAPAAPGRSASASGDSAGFDDAFSTALTAAEPAGAAATHAGSAESGDAATPQHGTSAEHQPGDGDTAAAPTLSGTVPLGVLPPATGAPSLSIFVISPADAAGDGAASPDSDEVPAASAELLAAVGSSASGTAASAAAGTAAAAAPAAAVAGTSATSKAGKPAGTPATGTPAATAPAPSAATDVATEAAIKAATALPTSGTPSASGTSANATATATANATADSAAAAASSSAAAATASNSATAGATATTANTENAAPTTQPASAPPAATAGPGTAGTGLPASDSAPVATAAATTRNVSATAAEPAVAAQGTETRSDVAQPAQQTQAPQPLAAAAPAAAASAPRPALAPQLSQPMLSLVQAGDGDHQVTVTVSPENLGPVTVRAHISGHTMHLELYAPSDIGRDALRHILTELRRDLAVAAPNASLSLATGDQPAAQQGQSGNQASLGQHGQQFGNGQAPSARARTLAADVPPDTPGAAPQHPSSTSTIDIFA